MTFPTGRDRLHWNPWLCRLRLHGAGAHAELNLLDAFEH